MAIANTDNVVIMAITKDKTHVYKEIPRPSYKDMKGEIQRLKDTPPAITWGYGHSPMMKDRCYATLVVAWGPLI